MANSAASCPLDKQSILLKRLKQYELELTNKKELLVLFDHVGSREEATFYLSSWMYEPYLLLDTAEAIDAIEQ